MKRLLLLSISLLVLLSAPIVQAQLSNSVRRHETATVTAGAGCGGNAVSMDEETCDTFWCNGSTWVQCLTGGTGGSCSGSFTENRVIKANATGTSCSFEDSGISEDGTTVCVISDDFGVVNDKWVFWDSTCSSASTKDAGIRWDVASTPDEFDFDVDGTTRVNVRAITTGLNPSLAYSAQTLNLSENVSYTTSQSPQAFRGFDVTGTMTVADPTVLNGDFENWDCTGSLTGAAQHWSDRHRTDHLCSPTGTCPSTVCMDRSSQAASGSFSVNLLADGPGDGSQVQSRAYGGSAYLTLDYATTYELSFSYRTIQSSKSLGWTVYEFGAGGGATDNCTPSSGCYTLRNSATPVGGSPGSFTADEGNCNSTLGSYPYEAMTGDSAWHSVTKSFTTRAGSGSFPAAVFFCNGGSTFYGNEFQIDAVSFPEAQVDTGLSVTLIATDSHIFKPKTDATGQDISFSDYTAVLAKPKLQPQTVASSTVGIDNYYGIKAGLAYDDATGPDSGTTTVNNAYSGYFETPGIGTTKYAIYADGTCAISNGNVLKWFEPSGGGSEFTSWEAQAQAADARYQWPAAIPTGAGMVLSCTNGTPSACSWITPGAGGTVTGTGTTNRMTKWTNGAGGVLGNSGIAENGSDAVWLAGLGLAQYNAGDTFYNRFLTASSQAVSSNYKWPTSTPTENQILAVTNTGSSCGYGTECLLGWVTPSSAGEANTASNLGGGLANFDSKSGVDLRFNSFAAADFDLASNLLTIDDTKWSTDAQASTAATAAAALRAPADATYLTQTADATLSAEQAMGALATGLVKNATTTGVQSIYAGTSCSAGNAIRVLDASGAATTCEPIPASTGTNTGDQNIFQTVSGNSGSAVADTTTDTLTLTGAGITNIVCASTPDTCTVTSTEAQNLFATIDAPAGTDPVADTTTDTLTLTVSGIATVTGNSATDTLTIGAVEAQNLFQTVDASSGTDPVADTITDTLIVAGTSPIVVTGDSAADSLTISVTGLSGTNTGDQNIFQTFDAPAGTDPVADTTTDTLTLTASGIVTITGTAGTDTLAFAATEAQNLFQTIDASSGTDPVADAINDTLIVTGTSPIVVTGDSTADSLVISVTGLSGTNTGDQNIFQTVSTSSGTAPVADTTTDTLTLNGTAPIVITGTAGTDTVVASCIVATGSVAGCLSAADWTTFNAKQAALTNYVATVADGTGIDGTATGAGSTYTPTLDLTEVTPTAVLGAGSFTSLTFDAGTCDPRVTSANKVLSLSCVNGTNNELLAFDFDSTANDVGISSSTGVTQLTSMNLNRKLDNSDNVARQLIFREPSTSGTNVTSLRAGPMASDINYILPLSAVPASRTLFLSATSTGQMAWTVPSSTGGAFVSGSLPVGNADGDLVDSGLVASGGGGVITIDGVSNIDDGGFGLTLSTGGTTRYTVGTGVLNAAFLNLPGIDFNAISLNEAGTITPDATSTYNLGSSSLKWLQAYVDTVTATTMTATTASFVTPRIDDGVGNYMTLAWAAHPAGNRTVTFPNLGGTVDILAVAQTFSAVKTFSAMPIFALGTQYTASAAAASEGVLVNDSTQKAMSAFVNGIQQPLSGTIFTLTADDTCANTTSKTNIINATGVGGRTLPANFFVTGKTLRITARGRYGTKTLTPGNMTFDFELNGGSLVNVATTGSQAAPAVNLVNQYWEATLLLTCRTTGATGTVQAQGNIHFALTSGTSLDYEMVNTATATIDTTSTQEIRFSLTWATADAANTLTTTNTTIEVLN